LEPTRRREPEGSSDPPSPDEGEGQADSVESDQDAVIVLYPESVCKGSHSSHPMRCSGDSAILSIYSKHRGLINHNAENQEFA
jgi:hypothetical protein